MILAQSNDRVQCHENVFVDQFQMSMHGIQTAKVFIVWGHRYMERTGFKWWYQTAIVTYLGDDPYVLDPYEKNFSTPVRLTNWLRYWTNPMRVAKAKDCVLGTMEKLKAKKTLDLAPESCTIWFASQFELHPDDLLNHLEQEQRLNSFRQFDFEWMVKRTGRGFDLTSFGVTSAPRN